jgi:glutamate-1-semialdehyde 2,1-aminomutase
MVRMVNSGTEATLVGDPARARRHRARAHRQVRGLLPRPRRQLPGEGRQRRIDLRRADLAGRAQGLADLTLTLPYNDFDAATALFDECGGDIAGLIIEPVVGNANCLPPREGYLQHLRELCTRHGTVLIFDEVMTGFRVALGGAQARYGVTPDLSTFGKIIGGGMPVWCLRRAP